MERDGVGWGATSLVEEAEEQRYLPDSVLPASPTASHQASCCNSTHCRLNPWLTSTRVEALVAVEVPLLPAW